MWTFHSHYHSSAVGFPESKEEIKKLLDMVQNDHLSIQVSQECFINRFCTVLALQPCLNDPNTVMQKTL